MVNVIASLIDAVHDPVKYKTNYNCVLKDNKIQQNSN